MKEFCDSFDKIKIAYEATTRRDAALICKHGFYGGCPVLKLQKATWTNDDMRTAPNKTGIFFSVWLDDQSLSKNRLNYNIHALKLRQLAGYKLTSRAFAADFREQFRTVRFAWPNVSLDYGPLTLMQGWAQIAARTFQHDVLNLMNHFGEVGAIIDELLSKQRRAR